MIYCTVFGAINQFPRFGLLNDLSTLNQTPHDYAVCAAKKCASSSTRLTNSIATLLRCIQVYFRPLTTGIRKLFSGGREGEESQICSKRVRSCYRERETLSPWPMPPLTFSSNLEEGRKKDIKPICCTASLHSTSPFLGGAESHGNDEEGRRRTRQRDKSWQTSSCSCCCNVGVPPSHDEVLADGNDGWLGSSPMKEASGEARKRGEGRRPTRDDD